MILFPKIDLISSEKDSSKTVIKLIKGKVITEIKEKLNPNETFEVETPNSIMAVRGTTFSVELIENEKEFLMNYKLSKGEVDLLVMDNSNNTIVVNSLKVSKKEAVTLKVNKDNVIKAD